MIKRASWRRSSTSAVTCVLTCRSTMWLTVLSTQMRIWGVSAPTRSGLAGFRGRSWRRKVFLTLVLILFLAVIPVTSITRRRVVMLAYRRSGCCTVPARCKPGWRRLLTRTWSGSWKRRWRALNTRAMSSIIAGRTLLRWRINGCPGIRV